MDFMGVNGQNQSISIITFQLTPLNTTDTPTIETINDVNQIAGQMPVRLEFSPQIEKKCNTKISADDNITNTLRNQRQLADNDKSDNSGTLTQLNAKGMPLKSDAFPCDYEF